jgi:hypothetical protein
MAQWAVLGLATGGTMNIKLNGFDYFVLAGGLMNILVIAFLVGLWLLH